MEQNKFFLLGANIFSDKNLIWEQECFIAVWTLYCDAFTAVEHFRTPLTESVTFLLSYILKRDDTDMVNK